jgi:site-specific recombinase
MDLAPLLEGLDPEAPPAQRHRWLIDLLAWVRGDARDPQASVERLRRFVDTVAADEALRRRWQRWWSRFVQTLDLTPLLADYGFAPRTAFLSELAHRLGRKLLPATPDTRDLGELFDLLLPSPFDVRWLQALDTTTLQRLRAVLLTPDTDAAPADAGLWPETLLDALTLCCGQIAAIGLAHEIRTRMGDDAQTRRAFHDLPVAMAALREAVRTYGPAAEAARQAAEHLQHQLERCRQAAQTVYAHLDSHGVSVGIVFLLRQLRSRILRCRQLLDCLLSPQPERAAAALLADLVQLSQERRSIRALIAHSTHLTAAKVAERSAESGEHYITRDAAEYRQMLARAAGGGAVLGFTTWTKFTLTALALSAFWEGMAAGLNYALSFVFIYLLHGTVATKQPAVTAPAMVAKLRDIRAPGAVRHFVDEVAHLLRSQIAAIVGNVGAVVPVVLLISGLLSWALARPMIDTEKAWHVLHDTHLLGPTPLYAALTGVLLFAASIVAGWVENWFVFHRLDSALAHHPRRIRRLGAERAARQARWVREHVSGLTANVALGLMLGLVPAIAGFFGLGLEVRHVTLSAGQVAAAAAALGPAVLHEPAFWWAVAGVLIIGPLNLAVSFYLAFRLALKATGLGGDHRQRIAAALRLRVRRAPLSFLWPPRTPSADDDGEEDAPVAPPVP